MIGSKVRVQPRGCARTSTCTVHERRKGIRRIVESLAARGHLREGLAVDRAADIVYGLHRPEIFAAFVGECGWPVEEFKAWSYRLLCDQLLSPAPHADPDQPPTRGLTFDEALS